jgi:pyruvate,water dikinase
VIDVTAVAEGRVLRVLLNAELDEALGVLSEPAERGQTRPGVPTEAPRPREEYWRWRLQMAERLAAELDPDRFGVRALYVLGSTKNATAGPSSDIDLLVHFDGTETQRRELERWLEGWSLSMAEINYLRTGYRSEGLLDVHFVADRDIERRSSFAAKIGAVTDAARPLRLKHEAGGETSP